MIRALIIVSLFLSCASQPKAHSHRRRHAADSQKKKDDHDAMGHIVLNGERVEVRWTDGDSFHINEGEYKRASTRLQGYNSLEAYGPVHRWGTWTARELYEIAKASSQVAASKEWTCTTDGQEDGYKRVLIDCPELAVFMAHEGHGLAYAVEGQKPRPEVLAAQKDAQANKRGMWAKGTTNGVITSLHALGEDGSHGDVAYNRIADTRTGEAHMREHHSAYETCEEVCIDTDGTQSCMVYVPFKIRYRSQPDCLK